MRKGILVLVLGLLVSGLVFASGTSEATAKESGQVLHIVFPVVQQNWSPFQGGGHAARWQSLMWAAPMYFDKKGVLTPYVLSSAEPDASYVTWTLKMNPKAVFSDGSPITAKDLVGTWNLCTRPATKHARIDLFLGGVKGFVDVSRGNAKDLTGLVIKDDRTVIVTLAGPDPIFDQKIATALIAPEKFPRQRIALERKTATGGVPKRGSWFPGPSCPSPWILMRES